MSALAYRPLDPRELHDLAVCQAVFRQAPSFVYPTGGRPATDDDVAQMFERLPAGVDSADLIVGAIEEDGATCGFYAVLRKYPDARTAYVALLILVEEAQGRSLGARVLDHIEAEAMSWGCTVLAGVVDSKNETALRFWARHGFIEEFRKPAKGFMGDAVGIRKIVL